MIRPSQSGSNASRPQPASVLILLGSDKTIDVFSDGNDRCRIVRVPDTKQARGELLVEELLQLRLDHFWQRVYRDGYLIGSDVIKPFDARDIQLRDFDISISRSLDRVEKILRGGK